jgi:hypothetical protein
MFKIYVDRAAFSLSKLQKKLIPGAATPLAAVFLVACPPPEIGPISFKGRHYSSPIRGHIAQNLVHQIGPYNVLDYSHIYYRDDGAVIVAHKQASTPLSRSHNQQACKLLKIAKY